jgi:hypothetical protein
MSNLQLKYITTESNLYQKAVEIRIEQFFKNMENSSTLINDNYELEGIHLVCLNGEKVIGTGRLNIEGATSVVSQMAIASNFQKKGYRNKNIKRVY